MTTVLLTILALLTALPALGASPPSSGVEITVSPRHPDTNGLYRVVACDLPPSETVTVTTSGPRDVHGAYLPGVPQIADMRTYPTDASGCLAYEATAPPVRAYYRLEIRLDTALLGATLLRVR